MQRDERREQRLLIRAETAQQRDNLVRFLHDRQIEAEPDAEADLTVEVAGQGTPPPASVVAAVEEWRAPTSEVVLELGESRTVLRTEA